jgi:HSP20 family protein
MNALTRLERMDDLFGEMFRRWRPVNLPADLPQDIRLNVTENDKEYLIKAEMPGVKKEDIRVSIDGNTLTISAESKKETEKKDGERVLMRELSEGSIARGITLAYEVNEAESSAKFENGVLDLTLPKRREARGRSITVA